MGAFLPLMSRFFTNRNTKFEQTLYFTMKYLLIASLGLTAGTWLVGDELVVALFGGEYLASGLALKLLNSSLIFSFWNFVGTNILIATDKEKMLVPVFSIGAAIHVIGNLMLIHFFSFNGAAASVIATQGIQLLIVCYFARAHISFKKMMKLAVLPLVSLAPLVATVWALKGINLWLAIGAGCGAYLLTLILLKVVNKREIMEIRGYQQAE